MEKNSILASPAAATRPPPTTRNVSPDLLRARMAVLAILQSHEAEATKCIPSLPSHSTLAHPDMLTIDLLIYFAFVWMILLTLADVQQLQAEEQSDISPGLASMCTYYGYELWGNQKFDLAHRIYTKAAELDPSPVNLLNLAISSKEYLHDSKRFHELLLKVEGIRWCLFVLFLLLICYEGHLRHKKIYPRNPPEKKTLCTSTEPCLISRSTG